MDKLKYWLPVDWYNGGMEHVTRHLLYSRFWHQFLYDIGVVPTKEPYAKRTAQGLILGSDGEKMSKCETDAQMLYFRLDGRGFIDTESFSQDDIAYLAKGKTEKESLGAFYWWEATEFVGEDREGHYALCPVLTGADGQRRASVSNNQEISRGAFAMTRTCRYQAAVMRWVDMMYDPVMSAQNDWGPIGVTLAYNADGLLEQIPAAEGESAGERRQKVAPGGPKAIWALRLARTIAHGKPQ